MRRLYYILDGHTPVPVDDARAWGRMSESVDYVVAQTQVTPEVLVSTVFLGLDHQWGHGPPLLFEAMVFVQGKAADRWRMSTWEEAECQHEAVLASLRQSASPEEPPHAPHG